MNKLTRMLLWLVVLPILSLAVSYACIRISDGNVSRASVAVLSSIAVILPILVLAFSIRRMFFETLRLGTILASLLASAFWVLLAALVNMYSPIASADLSVSQSVISIIAFTIITIVILSLPAGLVAVSKRGRKTVKS